MGFKQKYTPWQRKAIRALEKSISHWERMEAGAHGENESPGPDNCDCCQEFFDWDDLTLEYCFNCPIRLRSGYSNCVNTPYLNARDAFFRRAYGVSFDTSEIKREIDFLKETLKMVKNNKIIPLRKGAFKEENNE